MRTFSFLLRPPVLRLSTKCSVCRVTDRAPDVMTKPVYSSQDLAGILNVVADLSRMACGCSL